MKNILLAAMLLSLFAACKKDKDDDFTPQNPPVYKIVGFTYDNPDVDAETISYDAQGRVVKVEDKSERITVEYNGNNVKVKEWRKDENREVYNVSGVLNAQGRLTSIAGTSSYSSPEALQTILTSYEYNADGFVTKRIDNRDNGTHIYEYRYAYTSGNLTERKVYKNGVLEYYAQWTYGNDDDPIDVNFEYFNCANTFTGKHNAKLPVKYTSFNSNGTVNWWVDFVYTFDQYGYPKTCKNAYSNGDKLTVTYKYD
ncbi:MAG: DUF4595 domain-containing protein [Saprospiraceae bacterium]|nr:DUF4595 domain-containing protein [Saprospiraceae bacterium]